MQGWVKLHRSLAENELWTAEPFTYGQAWVDLLIHANHKPTSIFIRGIEIKLDRGDLGWSEITMTKRWKWSRGKVRRYLGMLENRGMIVQQKTQLTTIVSICNYTSFQDETNRSDTPDDTTNRTTDDTPDSTPDGTQRKNVKNDKNNTPSENSSGNPPEKPPPSKYKYSDDQYRLAEKMAIPVQARFPAQKINIEQWADAVRKLNELDGHDLADIRSLWVWIVNHDRGNFSWADNCRSPMKLRDKKDGLPYFDLISNQRDRELQAGGPGNGAYKPTRKKSLAEESWEESEAILADIEARENHNGPVAEDETAFWPQVGQPGGAGQT